MAQLTRPDHRGREELAQRGLELIRGQAAIGHELLGEIRERAVVARVQDEQGTGRLHPPDRTSPPLAGP
jgi:hypothetical protein